MVLVTNYFFLMTCKAWQSVIFLTLFTIQPSFTEIHNSSCKDIKGLNYSEITGTAEGMLNPSVSLMKMLKNIGLSTDPYGTLFVTGLHLDVELLITTIWARPHNHFLIH